MNSCVSAWIRNLVSWRGTPRSHYKGKSLPDYTLGFISFPFRVNLTPILFIPVPVNNPNVPLGIEKRHCEGKGCGLLLWCLHH